MFIQQMDLFPGMARDFVKRVLDITARETIPEGAVIFGQGDPADYFYILLKGRIRLTIGEDGHSVYVVSKPGEAFGWSSLLGRKYYSASAQCMEETRLLRMEKTKLQEILDKDPINGLIFFKKLSGILGNRLLQIYQMISSAPEADSSRSYGSGQTMEPSEPD